MQNSSEMHQDWTMTFSFWTPEFYWPQLKRVEEYNVYQMRAILGPIILQKKKKNKDEDSVQL